MAERHNGARVVFTSVVVFQSLHEPVQWQETVLTPQHHRSEDLPKPVAVYTNQLGLRAIRLGALYDNERY